MRPRFLATHTWASEVALTWPVPRRQNTWLWGRSHRSWRRARSQDLWLQARSHALWHRDTKPKQELQKSSLMRRFIFVTVHANNVIKTYLWRTYDKILIVIFVASHLLHGDALVFFVIDRVTSMTLSPPSLIYFSRCSSGHVYDGDVYTCMMRMSTRVWRGGWHVYCL